MSGPHLNLVVRIVATIVFAVLSGCASPLQLSMPAPEPPLSQEQQSFERWVNLHTQVQGMTHEEASVRLQELDSPEGQGQRFYFGLLHSQSKNYPDWIRARDAFNAVAKNSSLSQAQRGLADLLRQYNQLRINAYVRQLDLESSAVELRRQLVAAEDEKTQLQQKIQALTELETIISTRKEE